MEPISAAAGAFKAGQALAGLLFASRTIEIVNECGTSISVAVCIGSRDAGHSAGWINIPAGHTHGRTVELPVYGTDVVIYGEASRKTWEWDVPINFYVLDGSGFVIKAARLTSSRVAAGTGTRRVVTGGLYRVSGNWKFTFR
ncbi:hypothetical protein JOD54_004535 [Actinokineospora baliensis]|uniref:hypothetical protein n=1 Tax=Actinokineospora baliensis TaxID=547056 RepID=UPI001958EFD4|nr:hypothetical protein [Actinokineospora baliensis]MBM7774331.1 hypothetical protein [Actinokineospora baliensis]